MPQSDEEIQRDNQQLVQHPERINVAALRRAQPPPPVAVDQMSRRGDNDVFEGHFCAIDLSNADAKKAVEAVIGEGNAHFGSGDYGVYLQPIDVDENGYPLTAQVLLRDEHSCVVYGVPYASLSPADPGRR